LIKGVFPALSVVISADFFLWEACVINHLSQNIGSLPSSRRKIFRTMPPQKRK